MDKTIGPLLFGTFFLYPIGLVFKLTVFGQDIRKTTWKPHANNMWLICRINVESYYVTWYFVCNLCEILLYILNNVVNLNSSYIVYCRRKHQISHHVINSFLSTGCISSTSYIDHYHYDVCVCYKHNVTQRMMTYLRGPMIWH